MEKEVWKSIVGYEGLYEVSNKGNVRSSKSSNKNHFIKGRKDRNGYIRVNLWNNGKRKTKTVHRLVIEAFIDNNLGFKMSVNHKNEIKEDNRLENLEYCSVSYNDNYGERNNKIRNSLSKKVFQYSKDGVLIKEWKSTMQIERELHISNKNISACCTGRVKTSHGYIWKYINTPT